LLLEFRFLSFFFLQFQFFSDVWEGIVYHIVVICCEVKVFLSLSKCNS
jgi:hypothetical protein